MTGINFCTLSQRCNYLKFNMRLRCPLFLVVCLVEMLISVLGRPSVGYFVEGVCKRSLYFDYAFVPG